MKINIKPVGSGHTHAHRGTKYLTKLDRWKKFKFNSILTGLMCIHINFSINNVNWILKIGILRFRKYSDETQRKRKITWTAVFHNMIPTSEIYFSQSSLKWFPQKLSFFPSVLQHCAALVMHEICLSVRSAPSIILAIISAHRRLARDHFQVQRRRKAPVLA